MTIHRSTPRTIDWGDGHVSSGTVVRGIALDVSVRTHSQSITVYLQEYSGRVTVSGHGAPVDCGGVDRWIVIRG